MADLNKQKGQNKKGGGGSAAAALADLKQSGIGGGGSGSGPGGGGIYDVYVAMVIEAVQPNWSVATYSRTNLAVQVRIKLDKAGHVQDCRIEKSSGRSDFDASAVNAVLRTKTLPEPPTPEQQDIVITFNSQMLG